MSASKNFANSAKPTLCYTIFLHLSELKIREKCIPCLPLIKSKLLITDTLISRTKNQSNFTDLEALNQEQIFRQRLRLSMLRILRQSRSGLSDKTDVSVKSTKEKKITKEMKRNKDDDEEELSAKRRKPTNQSEAKEIIHLYRKEDPRRALTF